MFAPLAEFYNFELYSILMNDFVVIEMKSKQEVSTTVDIFLVILNFLNISDPFMGLRFVLL